jgi:predicted nucleic acid-binding protein
VTDAGDSSGDDAGRTISVVDAVCCVYFCAAGKSGLLVKILAELGMEILIPEEVEREVLGKHRYGQQLAVHWRRLKASNKVTVLPELTFTDARADVVAAVVRVRGMSVQLALTQRRDLGEAVVIGHAKVLADAGHEVLVVIDDRGGQILASTEGLPVLTVEDLLLAAVQLHLVTADKLQATYESLLPFGSGLPTWAASELRQKYRQWRHSAR